MKRKPTKLEKAIDAMESAAVAMMNDKARDPKNNAVMVQERINGYRVSVILTDEPHTLTTEWKVDGRKLRRHELVAALTEGVVEG
jgi:hypothetical protein